MASASCEVRTYGAVGQLPSWERKGGELAKIAKERDSYVYTLYKARRTHIANEKGPHSKASSACNCDQAPGHTRMPHSQARC